MWALGGEVALLLPLLQPLPAVRLRGTMGGVDWVSGMGCDGSVYVFLWVCTHCLRFMQVICLIS